MYLTTAIALAVLTFTDRTFGAPNPNPSYCPSLEAVTVTVTAPYPPATPDTVPPRKAHTAKAVYFITNAEDNSIVAVPIGSDGLLTGDAVYTSTGGKGLAGKRATGVSAFPDSLFSQGAVDAVDDLVFAVNAGSNTVSVLQISPDDPCKLTLIGTPQSTGGEFPVSVTFSSALSIACVANGGAVDGISCFSVSRKTGLSCLDSAPRPLGLGQMTPAVGPTNTIGQVHFAQDSSSLMVTVKGNAAVNDTGFIADYPVVNGVVSQHPIKSSPPGTTLLFGIALIDADTIIVADPTIGAVILEVDHHSYTATIDSLVKIKNQTATCWTAFSSKVGSAYVTDGGQNHLVEIDPKTGEVITDLKLTNGNAGMFDETVGGDYLYALSPNANKTFIAAFDLSGGRGTVKAIQNFEVVGLTGGTAMGLRAI